jgi:hypothetical protein
MAASFVTESCLVPGGALMDYLGLKDSSSLAGTLAPYYTGGLVKYEMFIPDPAAVATNGLTGSKLPALVQMHAQGGGEWTGTLAAPTGNSGAQTQLAGQPGDKLGRNTTPDTNWPTYGIFPQLTTDWDASSSDNAVGTTGGVRKQRAGFAIIEAVVKDAMTKYPIDRNRLILTGVSSGGTEGYGYLFARARYPRLFTLDFAAFIGIATWIGTATRGDLPESPGSAEDYTLSTAHRVARDLVRLGVPLYLVNSMGDGIIVPGDLVSSLGFLSTQAALRRYWPTAPAQALTTPVRDYYDGGNRLQIINYTTGSPTHNNVWPMAYSDNVPGAAMDITKPMYVWMMAQRRSDRQRRKKRAA